MKDSKVENNIKAWIISIMEKTNCQLDLVEHRKGINMSYNFITNQIGVDLERIQQARKELTIAVSLKTYTEVMTLHELGHAADRVALLESLPQTIMFYDLKKAAPRGTQYNDHVFLKTILDEQLMNIEFEKTAWNYAETMNNKYQFTDDTTFKAIRQHGLGSYEQPYLQNTQLYACLLADDAELTA